MSVSFNILSWTHN